MVKTGGAGPDHFQMEGYGSRRFPWLAYFNRDDPTDYNYAEDAFYGADPVYELDYSLVYYSL